MQRTTVRLPDDLLDEAKERARLTGRTLTQLLEDAVRAELAHTAKPPLLRVAERSVRYHARATASPTEGSVHAYPTGAHAATEIRLREQLRAQVADIQEFLRAIPDRDARPADEILGYDTNGLPG